MAASASKAKPPVAAYQCRYCGAKWLKSPKKDRRALGWNPTNKRRFGRGNRRHVTAYKCCAACPGVAR